MGVLSKAADAVTMVFERFAPTDTPTMSSTNHTAHTGPHMDLHNTDADLITEVAPEPVVYDTIRERVVDHYFDRVDDLFYGDVRAALRIESIHFDPANWEVDANIREIQPTYPVPADNKIANDVIAHARAQIDARFDCLDASSDALVFKNISMKRSAWFVEAVIVDNSK